MKKKLLVVDDIPAVREFIMDALGADYDVTGVANAAEALGQVSSRSYDMVITDVVMPDMSGEELTARIKERDPDLPVLAVTAYGNADNATRIMNMGAFDYLEKPFTIRRLRHTVEKAFEFASLKQENRTLQTQLEDEDRIKRLVGNSVQMQHVREKVELVARASASVLITGESGVGKELVAHEIHRLGDRGDRAFLKVNCASTPPSLLEIELFGREKTAYTGAVDTEPGKLELANNGTILLDEIAEMDLAIQARLLRVIQEGEFDRSGGTRPVKVDTRIIATTSKDLKEEIRKRRFREDLYYRLNVVPLEIPPLRDRREDIPHLIRHFVEVFTEKNGGKPVTLTEAAVDKLCNAYWKGNVRQLQNVIERAVILKGGMVVDADYFQFENEREEQLSRVEHAFRFGSIREMEKLMILHRLKDHKNNRTRSAESLDISVRTLRNKLNEYNVPKKHDTRGIDEFSRVSDR